MILAQEPMLPEYQVQAHMHPESPDLYASETVEAPMPIAFEALTPPVQQASPIRCSTASTPGNTNACSTSCYGTNPGKIT